MTVIDLQNRMITTEYRINKEKRTIVCIITTVNDVALRMNKYGFCDCCYCDNDFDDVRVYKGIARCAPEDEWDETYGKRLAEYRASLARRKDVNTELTKYVNATLKCVDNLYNYGLIKAPKIPAIL